MKFNCGGAANEMVKTGKADIEKTSKKQPVGPSD
jgi:hypothetical protein